MTTILEMTKDMYKKDLHSEDVTQLVKEFKVLALTVKSYIQEILNGTITKEMLSEYLEDEELENIFSLRNYIYKNEIESWFSSYEDEGIVPLKIENFSEFTKAKNYLTLLYEVFENTHKSHKEETVDVFCENYPFELSFDDLGF